MVLYGYVQNNPINYKDPSGMSPIGDAYAYYKWLRNADDIMKLALQIRVYRDKASDALSRGKCEEAIIYDQGADNLEKIYYQRLLQLGLTSPLSYGPPNILPPN